MSKASLVLSLMEKSTNVYDKIFSDPTFIDRLSYFKNNSEEDLKRVLPAFLPNLTDKEKDNLDMDALIKKIKEFNPRRLQKKAKDKQSKRNSSPKSGKFEFKGFPFSWERDFKRDDEGGWRSKIYFTLPKSKVKEFEVFLDDEDNEEDLMNYLVSKDIIGTEYGTGSDYSPTGRSFSHGPSKLYKSKTLPNVWMISQSGGLDI